MDLINNFNSTRYANIYSDNCKCTKCNKNFIPDKTVLHE